MPAAVVRPGEMPVAEPQTPDIREGSVPGGDSKPAPVWRGFWQLPVLAVSSLLLVGGLAVTVMRAPKPDLTSAVDTAHQMIEAGQHGEALAELNAKVLPLLAKPEFPDDQRRQFHVLRARAIFLGQKAMGLDRPDNNANVIGEYRAAEKLHTVLEPRDQNYFAQTVLSVGDFDEAVRRAEMLAASEPELRTAILREVVEKSMIPGPANEARALDLIGRLTADPTVDDELRLWALARQGELLVRSGYADDAISRILRAAPRLQRGPAERMGELLVVLATAYMAEDAPAEAAKQLDRAAPLIGDEHALMARVHLMRGRIAVETQGDLLAAREHFKLVAERFSFSSEALPAQLGQAEVEFRLGIEAGADGRPSIDAASDLYALLVDRIGGGEASAEVTREILGSSIERAMRELSQRGAIRDTLRLGVTAERLYGRDKLPASVLLMIASDHLRLADGLLAGTDDQGARSIADADPATQREARDHLITAASYFRDHAARQIQVDAGEYADSLWNAADAFDRAGDASNAVSAFRQFAQDLPTDKRYPEARFRLAQAYQARGDLDQAAALYREMIAEGSSGPFADASYVPLAQTYLMDGDPANDAQAEQLLRRVVDGAIGGVGAPVFRTALYELGQYYAAKGEYERAIERFDEFLGRYNETDLTAAADGIAAMYKLADSCRLSAVAIESTLATQALPDSERIALETTRRARLERAGERFDMVRRALDSAPRRTALQDVYLRNAYFYAGDCAFDLRNFDDAIRAYDAAKERYSRDPASLVAMVQIVNALIEKGELDKAKTANTRARRFFESLPASAWDDPTLPMTRKGWERWLDSQAALGLFGPTAAAGGDE